MKVIIIENELYLAQSIASKLGQKNFDTEIYSSISDALDSNGDIYLLSTTIPGQNPLKIIEKFKDKIIILIVNYINNDTVVKPLEMGAKDYIVKPFKIEELIRKIEHYYAYKKLQKQNDFYNTLLDSMFKEIDTTIDIDALELPLTLYTNLQKVADKVALLVAQKYDTVLTFVDLQSETWQKELTALRADKIAYISKLDTLKKDEREKLFEILDGKTFILASLDASIETPYENITLNSNNKLYDQNNILTINEYVQYIIKKFQYQYPDTELSKKLGISRKSLWEKRRKFELFKKK
ncbi:MAG TPA: response regulator [Nitratifractor sp.]|nr:response regulator [Nitratifractor sp.]HHD75147.1 response regulator [Nitratifractor sp.]